jgi:zinc transport system substrate-binding protein
MIVFHDAWFYFADYFDLEIVGAFEPIAGKSPSPKYLQSILDKIEKNNIDVLFIEPQLDPEIALAMAQGLVDNFEVLDPIGGLDERDSYINLIDYNVKTIIKALEN